MRHLQQQNALTYKRYGIYRHSNTTGHCRPLSQGTDGLSALKHLHQTPHTLPTLQIVHQTYIQDCIYHNTRIAFALLCTGSTLQRLCLIALSRRCNMPHIIWAGSQQPSNNCFVALSPQWGSTHQAWCNTNVHPCVLAEYQLHTAAAAASNGLYCDQSLHCSICSNAESFPVTADEVNRPRTAAHGPNRPTPQHCSHSTSVNVYLEGAGSALRPRLFSVRVLRVRARPIGRGLLGVANMLAVGFTSSLLCTQPLRPSKPPADRSRSGRNMPKQQWVR